MNERIRMSSPRAGPVYSVGDKPSTRSARSISVALSVEALHVLSISAIAEVIGPPRDQLYRTGERDLLPFGPLDVERSGKRPHADLPVGQPVQQTGYHCRARPCA